jgi:hypothetical protein
MKVLLKYSHLQKSHENANTTHHNILGIIVRNYLICWIAWLINIDKGGTKTNSSSFYKIDLWYEILL